ncbi:Crp/Fnr family transcriptional regulator [Campylobacter jejuni]|uniref:Crp/Fnr family transcriptional regulator n=1 Tax=Campylobacter TaxID=194 RepID=UPI00105A703E|nr:MULTISPECIES: Crp/Fnr family transcriptional regulator [Campylobacter]EAI4071043.1 Crp/Fnr family transcriptional regulator [Campylobacter jejuni]EAI4099059.1 Crp/Fnr family transcriptional regulator [Campylobacter jejuni]EAI4335768.1 Crp/Fnr family transcriptional regulator [Campylobacter jejuni]EAJ6945455.1 Crp/Fnr family transcriptional regulator [Campylobacter jejuni]EAJ7153674.1 Crp/Fnr family transcriptional regulator [Campylobacter jejuni]
MDKKEIISNFFKDYNLNQEDLNLIIQQAYFKKLPKDVNVLADECLGFVIVLSGNFRAFIMSNTAKEITIFELNKDDACMMCQDCVFEKIAYNIFIQSTQECEILIIPKELFTMLKDKYPKIYDYVLKLMAMRFNALVNILEQALFTPLSVRLNEFLKAKAKNKIISLSHEEIALHLGSSREVISRIIKTMQKEGFIQQNRKEIIILKDL